MRLWPEDAVRDSEGAAPVATKKHSEGKPDISTLEKTGHLYFGRTLGLSTT